jgi:ribonuclease P protein component
MRKEQRLTKDSEFATVAKQGRTWIHKLMLLKTLPNGLEFNRYGFIVSKKVGKAVVRNQVKRRMREVARLTPVTPGWDLVFIARSEAANAEYRDLKAAMELLLRRARLLLGV